MHMKRMVRGLMIFTLILLTLTATAQSRKEFIRKFKHIAIVEMEKTGIPASITLAQGILESGCGLSPLATGANNHFGIKCHDWEGATFQMDDDEKDECFRKYDDPEQSWIDHSVFLTTRPRYASLFKLSTTDYKGWAKGLKAAGYATNPQYAEILIRIIEEEELYKFDREIQHPEFSLEVAQNSSSGKNSTTTNVKTESLRNREEMRNGILCIEARTGDSFEKIAAYYGIKLKKLLAYNDKTTPSLEAGQYVYLKNKKNKAARGYDFHRVKGGETLYQISQMYGVKLKNLVKYNYINTDTPLLEGEKIYLRTSAGV